MATVDQLERILGQDWEQMRYGQLADRAHALEQAAGFAQTLARYVAELEVETAGEALERLQVSRSNGPYES